MDLWKKICQMGARHQSAIRQKHPRKYAPRRKIGYRGRKRSFPNRKRRLYREKETNGQKPEEHETQKLDMEKECEPPERAVSSLPKMRHRKPVSDQKIKEKKESIRESSRRMEQFQETEEISDDEYKEKKGSGYS